MSDVDGLADRVRAVLLGLALVSEGKGSTLAGDVIHGGEHDYTPRGERSLHDYHRRHLERCRTDDELRGAVEAAEQALSIARGGEARHRTSRTWDQFIVERYEGWSTADVAAAENCHRTQVWRAREKLRRHGANGTPKTAAARAA